MDELPSHAFGGIATPSPPPHLLPLARPPHLGAVSLPEDARMMSRGQSTDSTEDGDSTDDDGGTEPEFLFALDDVDPLESTAVAPLSSIPLGLHSTNAAPTSAVIPSANESRPAFASSHNLASRPFRARYDLSEPPEGASSTPNTSAASYKRGYEQVTPSTGSTPPSDSNGLLPPTPPASDSNSGGGSFSPLTSATTTAPRPPSSHYRHSFDSQRAVASSSLRTRFLREYDSSSSSHLSSGASSSTLRRRSPATSREGSRDRRTTLVVEQPNEEDRPGSPLDRSKRRRPSGTPENDREEDEDRRGFGNQRAIAPAQRIPRGYAIDPALQPPPVTTPAYPSNGNAAIEPTSTVGISLLRPRSARARPDVERERQFDPLVSFWREERDHERSSDSIERNGRAVLDAAEDTLRAAEQAITDARNLRDENGETRRERDEREVRTILASVGGRLVAADESISRTSAMLGRLETPLELPELPSTQHLPLPSQSHLVRPTVGVRVGEGWSTRAVASDDSAPSSPTSGADSPPLTSASRALHFLTNLRSRRPRLSRGSTGVPAPEDSPGATPPDRQGAWLSGAAAWSEQDEVLEADNLNQRLQAVRQAGNWPQRDESESLWGQVSEEPQSYLPTTTANTTTATTHSLLSRRMRGPTERANQLWRLGREPEAAATGVTQALRPDDAPRLVPRDDARPAPVSHTAATAHTFGPSSREGWRRLDSASESSTAERHHQPPEFGALDLHLDFPPSRLPPMHTRALSSDHSAISGSVGRRAAFPPAPTRGAPSLPSWPYESNRPTDSATRFHPAFGFEATSGRRDPPDPPRSLGARPPAPDATNLRTHRRTTLADALTHFGTREPASIDTTLRRRHTVDPPSDPAAANAAPAPQDIPDRTAQRQVRTERLASMRRERMLMQSLLGGSGGGGGGARDEDDAAAPRSPGSRLRHLGEFLRGFGPVGGGRFSLFDEDFGAFFGRDSAALDPRNYLDDDDFDTSYESLIRLQERLGDVKPVQGVSAAKLEQLKTFKYVDWPFPAPRKEVEVPLLGVATTSAVRMDEDRPALARRGIEKEERCPVCLMDYEDQDEVTLGECVA
ncbi:hypothetical protein RQP46_001051 [Phenoliferia psychrophenolica]